MTRVLTVGRLAKQFGLSRSTLLYYDSIGLLSPSARGTNGYRRYSEADVGRLAHIYLYRRAGLPLDAIRNILDEPEDTLGPLLDRRLAELTTEIDGLRNQQGIILALLAARPDDPPGQGTTLEHWIALFTAAGLREEDMLRWHADFERLAPDSHQAFLEGLGLPTDQIRDLRAGAATGARPQTGVAEH